MSARWSNEELRRIADEGIKQERELAKELLRERGEDVSNLE